MLRKHSEFCNTDAALAFPTTSNEKNDLVSKLMRLHGGVSHVAKPFEIRREALLSQSHQGILRSNQTVGDSGLGDFSHAA